MPNYILPRAITLIEVVQMKMVRILRRETEHFDVLDETAEDLVDEDGISSEEAGFLAGWEEAY